MAIPQACKIVTDRPNLSGKRVIPGFVRLGQINAEIDALEARILTLRGERNKVLAELERKN